jgi:hypothetical protein
MGSVTFTKGKAAGVYPPPSSAEVKETVELYLYFPFMACSRMNLLRFTVICLKCNSRDALLDTEFKFVEIYSWFDDAHAHASNNVVSGE